MTAGTATEPRDAPNESSRFVARWDLDKTYLRTKFETTGDLLRTAFERPEDKRAVPGASAVLKELGRSGARIHIVSGSPRQMRRRLEAKLRLDKVRWDELTLKPNLSNVLRLRFRALRDQLNYKLPVLLEARKRNQHLSSASGRIVRESLVGDDAEADAFVYSLYADVCEGEVDLPMLERVLDAGRVYADSAHRCLASAKDLDHGDVVERILIHLDRQSRPSDFDPYGPRVVPFFNYVQAAFVLAEDDAIRPTGVLRIAADFVLRHRFDADALARSYLDLLRRGHVSGALLDPLARALDAAKGGEELPAADELARMLDAIRGYLRNPPEILDRSSKDVDYVALASRHRGGRNRRRLRW